MGTVAEEFARLLYEHVKEYRRRTNTTQKEIARSIGYSPEWLSRVINGVWSPSRISLLVLASYLELSSEECDTLLCAIRFDVINENDRKIFSFIPIDVRDSAEMAFFKEVALGDYEMLLSAYGEMISSTREPHLRELEQSSLNRIEFAARLERAEHRLQALRILITAEMFEQDGAYLQARREHLSALEEARTSRDRVMESFIHMKLGDFACNRGDEIDAKCQYEEAEELLMLARTLDGVGQPFLDLLATQIGARIQAVSEGSNR